MLYSTFLVIEINQTLFANLRERDISCLFGAERDWRICDPWRSVIKKPCWEVGNRSVEYDTSDHMYRGRITRIFPFGNNIESVVIVTSQDGYF